MNEMNEIYELLKNSFNDRIEIREKRPNIYQLIIPLYHEDGDMIDIFIENQNGDYYLCDYGLTLMRLSYSYEIDTPNKETIFRKILSENRLEEINGNIRFETKKATLYPDILHVTQAYMKIGSMRYFKREVIESLFYELLDDIITSELSVYKPVKNVLPLANREDLEADYEFRPNGHPVYLFGVKDAAKARLATICCLEYQKADIKFRSLIVHENFEKLPQKDSSRLTNACDKQYTSLDDFKNNVKMFLEREKD
jgi:hypothetical protein